PPERVEPVLTQVEEPVKAAAPVPGESGRTAQPLQSSASGQEKAAPKDRHWIRLEDGTRISAPVLAGYAGQADPEGKGRGRTLKEVVTVLENARVRARPDRNAKVVNVLTAGTTVTVVEEREWPKGKLWLRLEDDTWIAAPMVSRKASQSGDANAPQEAGESKGKQNIDWKRRLQWLY
ncbi:MAG: SH3 domain-containing protein, partial [Magnetococcales bacterium]|nr:SH3 domain-containing protein [Magnetococcales bacterium]